MKLPATEQQFQRLIRLTSETVQSAALSLQSMDYIKSSHSLATCMLSVGHCITDDVFQEDLQHTTGFLIDQTRDALDTTSSGKSANSRLGDALDVVSQHLSVALGT